MKMTCSMACAAVLFLIANPVQAQNHRFSPHPDSARFIADDIPRFWTALDGASPDSLAVILDREYLARGTIGLQGFLASRIRTAANLAAAVSSRRDRYEEIRELSMKVLEAERAIRASFYALEYLYPEAVFPNVYFMIGRLSTGGMVSDDGLLIGAEMFRSTDGLRSVVAHELIHFQQKVSGQWAAAEAAPSLLVVAIMEGSASFVSELLTGIRGEDAAHEYGRAHERAIWTEFEKDMHGTDVDNWFYRDPPGERPADIGYFVGYRIAEAYYNQAADKRDAIRHLLTTPDFVGLLKQSGYRPEVAQ
jgi:hypothetical protein